MVTVGWAFLADSAGPTDTDDCGSGTDGSWILGEWESETDDGGVI